METMLINKKVTCASGEVTRIMSVERDGQVLLANGRVTYQGALVWLPVAADGLRFALSAEPKWSLVRSPLR